MTWGIGFAMHFSVRASKAMLRKESRQAQIRCQKSDVEGYGESKQPQHANSRRERNALERPSMCLPLRFLVIISHDE
ncbi:hypothetical protein K3759_01085 [Sulfitobacter sp. W027]|uniref:hypothetical protein n=1 Tax=Sulfitobacter sp. W027 TaxID=2867025 RepID=UPI0021A48F32|nr:hypothetical protein [Sulfitobacter sp. W027]UWR33720.1 hypothetical protein K3759_01085 [Sulfitobacter sp. W027]